MTVPPEPRSWRIDLPWTKPPLSMNDSHGNRYARSRTIRAVRQLARAQALRQKIPPLGRCTITLHYAPRDARRRDPHNLVATLKPLEDGIVDAGVVPDDTPQYVPPSTPVIDPPTGTSGRLYLVVAEVT